MNYTDMRNDTVLPMLQRLGVRVTFIVIDEGELDPATGRADYGATEYEVDAIVTKRENKETDGGSTLRVLEVILAGTPEPSPGDMVLYEGSHYTVRELLQSVEPGGVSIYYKVRAEA